MKERRNKNGERARTVSLKLLRLVKSTAVLRTSGTWVVRQERKESQRLATTELSLGAPFARSVVARLSALSLSLRLYTCSKKISQQGIKQRNREGAEPRPALLKRGSHRATLRPSQSLDSTGLLGFFSSLFFLFCFRLSSARSRGIYLAIERRSVSCLRATGREALTEEPSTEKDGNRQIEARNRQPPANILSRTVPMPGAETGTANYILKALS